MKNKYDVIIAGAGVTGLTLAYLLIKKGFRVLIVEKNDVPGGLARSFTYQDGTFDVGPHRFHTDNQKINDIILEVLKDDLIYIQRKSSVHLYGLRHPWPIRLNTVIKLPKGFLVKSFLDLFTKPRFTPQMKSFEEYVISKYGKTLYSIFFRDYSRKFCRIEPSQLHYDWAMTGVERAIIDKRLQVGSLLDTIKVSLLPRPAVNTLFIYPRKGCYVYCNKICSMIEQGGAKVLTGRTIDRVKLQGNRITEIRAGEDTFTADRLVWTGNIKDLCSLLGMPGRYLPYLDIVLFNIIVDTDINVQDQWVYYGEKELVFTRISFPHNFSPYLFRKDRYGLCVEVTVKDQDLWENPEKYIQRVIDDLSRINLVQRNRIKDIRIERIRDAYPIYHIDYRKQLRLLKEDAEKFENLYLAGRTGAFFYNNMDNSIESALNLYSRFREEDRTLKT